MMMLRRQMGASPDSAAEADNAPSGKLADWYYAQILDAENSKIDNVRCRERLAWRFAGASLAVTLISVLGASAMVFYKRPDPPVIMRDNTVTGEVNILDVARSGHVTFGEAEDRADLRRYVAARESYDWETIQDMYDRVKETTCGKERDRYLAIYDGAAAPQKIFKDGLRVIARANVISFVGKTAQVFFEKRFVSLQPSVVAPKPEFGVATISYEHKELPGKRSELEANPTGFCVTSYTTERDWTRSSEESAPRASALNALPGAPVQKSPAAAPRSATGGSQ